MGAVPGFCGANHRSCIARKLLGTAPDEPGDSPEFTTVLLSLTTFGTVRSLPFGQWTPLPRELQANRTEWLTEEK